ncbi:MAG TPA: hypothetical protein VH024_17510 [Candidatus Angelobacter sp.]|jgi:hypothetical protein|nr:hypothetical protein [Candidatus Angelobacter sp.]
MVDTFTPSGRLQLQTFGGNNQTWGGIADTQYQLIESMITGVVTIDLTGLTSYSLTANNGIPDQARQLVYVFTGVLADSCTVTIPGVVKIGYAQNDTSGGFSVILQVSGIGQNIVISASDPGGTWVPFYCDGTNVLVPPLVSKPIPGFLFGLGLSNNSSFPGTSINIAGGTATDSNAIYTIRLPSSGITKTLTGQWTAGSGPGMGNGVTLQPSTWYGVFLMLTAQGFPDVYIDTSTVANNSPPGTIATRRIGMIKADTTSNIIQFYQNGDSFDWVAPVDDFDFEGGTTATWQDLLITLPRTPPIQCIGKYRAFFQYSLTSPGVGTFYLYRAGEQIINNVPSAIAQTAGVPTAMGLAQITIDNTNQQIRAHAQFPTANRLGISTIGWIDTRGRLG